MPRRKAQPAKKKPRVPQQSDAAKLKVLRKSIQDVSLGRGHYIELNSLEDIDQFIEEISASATKKHARSLAAKRARQSH
jgi:hypothetical protein